VQLLLLWFVIGVQPLLCAASASLVCNWCAASALCSFCFSGL
jgi:hypothetical protein